MDYGLKGAVVCLALGSVLTAIVWALTGSLSWSGSVWVLVTFGSNPFVAYYSDPEGWRQRREELKRLHVKN